MIMLLRGNVIHAPELGRLETLPRGWLVLEDGVIAGLYERLPKRYANAPVEDYGDCLILQSFADMHLHAPQYPMLGRGVDLPLLEWLDTYTFPMEAHFSDTAYARQVYRQLAQDLIDHGTTRVAMFSSVHRAATYVLMEELEAAGVAGCVGKVNMDRNCPDSLRETTEASLTDTERWLEECGGRFQDLFPILTPRFTPSCSDRLMAGLGRIAEKRGLPVQSHLSESLAEIDWVRELHPDCGRYWESYAKYGLWKERTIMAHCVHSDREEREAMRKAGVLAVHCPDSNTNLRSGIAPVRRMLEEGVRVALGSDIAGGALLSMWQVAAAAIRVSKEREFHDPEHPRFLTAAEAYYLASSAGHMYFGDAPGFAVGNRLHAVVVDDGIFPSSHSPLSLTERFERALYLTGREHIRAVYSGGRRVKG